MAPEVEHGGRVTTPAGAELETSPKYAKQWRRMLVDGKEDLLWARRVFRYMPSAPRCQVCSNPFAGPGGLVLRMTGFRRSRMNPHICHRCEDKMPPGGIETDVAVLFADVRGSTGIGEAEGSSSFAGLLNSFYKTATRVLIEHRALIDKLIGDEVMALFVPGLAGPDYRREAARAAADLVAAVGREQGLPLGAAVNAGTAFVGNVGTGEVMDLTALGDPVNAAARMQSHAAEGEVILAADLYDAIASDHAGARSERLNLRGREQPMDVMVVSAGAATPA